MNEVVASQGPNIARRNTMDKSDHQRRISQDISGRRDSKGKEGNKAAAPLPLARTKSKVDAVTK